MNPFCSVQESDDNTKVVKLDVSNVLVAVAALGVVMMAIYLAVFDQGASF